MFDASPETSEPFEPARTPDADDRLPILYQDEHLVAINKPAGLLVHRSAIDRHETRFAVQCLRDQLGQKVYPVHRLDKPTSGVLLFALSSEIARLMTVEFTERRVHKTYQAIVRGWPLEQAVIDYPLVEQLDKMTDNLDVIKPAQTAITEYQTLATCELPFAVDRYATSRYAWLQLKPKTGRKHQIRRHMHHISHPIIGDTTHGNGRHNRFFRQEFNCHRLLLAATELEFVHPLTQTNIVIEADLGADFQGITRLFSDKN